MKTKENTVIERQNTPTLNLSVLTLNCWGVPGARDREARINAIGLEIAQMQLDIVGLQEIFYEKDRVRLVNLGSAGGLIHHQYYPSGLMGSGLLILSRFPIIDTRFFLYRLNGRPQDLLRPDYYAGKGIAFARLQTPAGPIDFYNTHLIAPYLEIGKDVYFSHRVGQAVELTHALNSISNDLPLIVTGDFNTTPERLTYKTCVELGEIQDSYYEVNGCNSGETVTSDIPYLLVHEPERVDFIFFRSGGNQTIQAVDSDVVLSNVSSAYMGKIKAYSDHYGVYSTFLVSDEYILSKKSSFQASILSEAKSILEDGMNQVTRIKEVYFGISILAGFAMGITALLEYRSPITRRQFLKYWYHLTLVGLSALAILGLGLSSIETKEAAEYQKIIDLLEQQKDTLLEEKLKA